MRRTLKIFVTTFLFFFLSYGLHAQEEEEEQSEEENIEETTEEDEDDPDRGNWDRVFFGGNFALSFGNQNTFINISPRIGYRVTDKVSLGAGVTYMYWRINNRFLNGPALGFNTSVYGGNIFGRYAITPSIFAHSELEILSAEDFTTAEEGDRDIIPGFFVGGGYAVPLGRRSSLNIFVLYNLLFDNNVSSPYTSPIDIRIGMQF